MDRWSATNLINGDITTVIDPAYVSGELTALRTFGLLWSPGRCLCRWSRPSLAVYGRWSVIRRAASTG
jgi:hypothetical protein